MKQFAEIGLWVKRLKTHCSHEATYALPVYLPLLDVLKIIRHLAISPRWVFKMKLIESPHQFKILLVLSMCQILLARSLLPIRMKAINTAAVNLQQLALALNSYSLIGDFNKPDSLFVT